MVSAQVNGAAVLVGRAIDMDRITEGDGRDVGDMSLQMLKGAIDRVKLDGRREPDLKVTVQVGPMLMESIQEKPNGTKSGFSIIPGGTIATAMRWAKGLGFGNAGEVQSPIFSKRSIFLVANLHRGRNRRMLDEHSSEQSQAPVEHSVTDAEVLALLSSNEVEGVGGVLRIGGNSLCYAYAKSCSFSLSQGRRLATIEPEGKYERLDDSLLGLEGPRHGAQFCGQSLRLPESSSERCAGKLGLGAKMATKVPRIVDNVDGSSKGMPVVHLQPKARISISAKSEAFLRRRFGT
jgi:hypothetical protein